ncbi:MAG: hypothetical protein FJ216_07720 [Ignavibacteria bacterium]|nr:hypothetical protein [Ignavibacteria bacterium]
MDYTKLYGSGTPKPPKKPFNKMVLFAVSGALLALLLVITLIFLIMYVPETDETEQEIETTIKKDKDIWKTDKKEKDENEIAGNVMSAIYFSETDSEGYVYIIANTTILTEKDVKGTPIVPDGKNFKITLYKYDPFGKKISGKIVKEFGKTLSHNFFMFEAANKIWCTYSVQSKDVYIFVYDPNTLEELYNLDSFKEKYFPEKNKIKSISVPSIQNYIKFEFIDEEIVIYSPEYDKTFGSTKEYNDFIEKKSGQKNVAYFYIDKSKLYKTRKKESELKTRFHYFSGKDKNTNQINTSVNFPDGLVLWNDESKAVVIYKKIKDDNEERAISCVDGTGNILWTLEQKLLPDELLYKGRYTSSFFLQYNITGSLMNDILSFSLNYSGNYGYNVKEGVRIWEINYSK